MSRPQRAAAVAALFGCLCVLLVATGCGVTPGAAGPLSTATATTTPAGPAPFARLQVVRTSNFPTNDVPAFTATATDPAKIGQLYDAIGTFPPYQRRPTGTWSSCLVDLGVQYRLTFTRADGSQILAVADDEGCSWAGFEDGATGTITIGRVTDWNEFWSLFTSTLGVPMSVLDYTQSKTGPYAPTPSVP
jgi:hypothetical protein